MSVLPSGWPECVPAGGVHVQAGAGLHAAAHPISQVAFKHWSLKMAKH